MRWYEEHAEEVVAKSGIHSLFRSASLHQFDRQILLMNDVSRYNATSKTSAFDESKPFLTFPVLDDIGFLLAEEFKSISSTSEILPRTGNVFDLIEFDGNHLALKQNLMIKKGSSGAFPDSCQSSVLTLMLCRASEEYRNSGDPAAHRP
jgi:hypothetical protein